MISRDRIIDINKEKSKIDSIKNEKIKSRQENFHQVEEKHLWHIYVDRLTVYFCGVKVKTTL